MENNQFHKPLTVMQQIEDLKVWHKQQEQLLHKNYPSTHDYRHPKIDNEPRIMKTNEFSTSDSIEILPTIKEITNKQCFDDIPIKPCGSDFNKLLNNNLLTENENNKGKACLKPKRPFLRKGEGLARFRMTSTNVQKKNQKPLTVQQPTSSKNSKKLMLNLNNKTQPVLEPTQNKPNEFDDEPKFNKLLQQESPEPDQVDWKNLLNSMLANEKYSNFENSSQTDISISSLPESLLDKLKNIRNKNAREREEVRIFEMLEQQALDSSFCSSSSAIMRLMENSVKSTPVKEKQYNSISSNMVEKAPYFEKNEIVLKTSKQDLIDSNTSINNKEDQSMHVHFREENSYRFIDCSEGSTINEENYFGDNQKWTEECDCGCSTEYSSSDDDVRPISPPNSENVDEGKNILKSIENNNISNEIEHVGIQNVIQDFVDDSESKLDKNVEFQRQSSVINLRLKELEDEIEIFRKENAKLKKMQSDFEQDYKLFQNDKKTFTLLIEEEKRKNFQILEEEKQKLLKEKLVFQKHTKNINKNPNKEERREIQLLKEQITALREELSKKESRWGAAQARLRNQVKLLEDDNKKLKQEVEDIRKRSSKVINVKQGQKSNSHLLHSINKHLSAISPGDLADTFALNSKTNSNEKKHIEYKKVDKNKGYSLSEKNSESDFVSDVLENENEILKKNTLVEEIKKTVEDAMFEPISNVNIEQNITDTLDMKNVKEKIVNEVIAPNQTNTKINKTDDIVKENIDEDGNKEVHFVDGRKEILYKNGNVKKISPNGDTIKIVYFNGDVKEMCKDGKVKYYYGESRVWHTTYPDGLQVLDFPSGQVERRHLNGTIEIVYPNKCRKLTYTNKSEEWIYEDGTVIKIDADKQKVITYPNGQREIHTKDHKRREYPDGTVKLIYPDGTQETRYSNGRIRLKDKDGNLVMDTG